MKLTTPEYDESVVAAEPEIAEIQLQKYLSKQERNKLATDLEQEFSIQHTDVTVWDRNLSYPRNGHEYDYHQNLYRQLLSETETITVSWIQIMDMLYVLENKSVPKLTENLQTVVQQLEH